MQNIPTINNGKTPEEPYNAALGFWLPVDTPYGNFSLKLIKLSSRVDELNRNINSVYSSWSIIRSASQMIPIGAFDAHQFSMENMIYHIRRICDELISLIWCLSKWEEDNKWPSQIEIDDIYKLLNAKENQSKADSIISSHRALLDSLNGISNAFKHSFINTDHNLLGANEPCVHALGLKQNKLNSNIVFHNIAVTGLVNDFDNLYQDAIEWLRNFSKRHVSKYSTKT